MSLLINCFLASKAEPVRLPSRITPGSFRRRGLLVLLTCFLLLPLCEAQAQGFGVYEQGTCTMGRAGTGTAQPCNDGSAIFFNPAGLAGQMGGVASAGVTVIAAGGDFTSDATRTTYDLQNDPIPVPHVYVGYGFNDKLAAGLGVFVPYGLGTIWPTEGFTGRFLGYDNDLRSIYVQPTVAYRFADRIGVGAGLDVVFGAVELNQRVDLSSTEAAPGVTFAQLAAVPPGTDFADANLEGSSTGVGFNIGVLADVTDWLSVGVRYLSSVDLDYEGDASFDQIQTGIVLPPQNPIARNSDAIPDDQPLPLDPFLQNAVFGANGALRDQNAETAITMPAQIVFGVAMRPYPAVTLLFDYQRVQWSSFDVIHLDFEAASDAELIEDYEDTNGFRFAIEYTLNQRYDFRVGFITHEAAAPDQTVTPLLPEAYRNEFTLGFGTHITEQLAFDLAYQYIAQNERRGRVTEFEGGDFDPELDNDGLYSFNAHLFGGTLTFYF